VLQVLQHRRAQLVQPGERQLHLRLHARHARDPAPAGPGGQVLEQCGLAYARITVDNQDPALTGLDGIDEPVERSTFDAPARQLCRTASPSWCRGHLSPGGDRLGEPRGGDGVAFPCHSPIVRRRLLISNLAPGRAR